MVGWQADRLVEQFRRECRRLSVGGTVDGLSHWLWRTLSWKEQVDSALFPRWWTFVPPHVRDEFTAAVRHAASPEFHFPLWIRDGEPMTQEQMQADADLRTRRVRLGGGVRAIPGTAEYLSRCCRLARGWIVPEATGR